MNLVKCPKIRIGPSILNADLANLASESRNLLECGADYLHLDVMDGHFVPNISFGHSVVKSIRKNVGSSPFFDVHMMVQDPFRWVEPMADAGCTQYTYHFESTVDHFNLIRKIKETGMRVGVALKPSTSVGTMIPDLVSLIDMILIMTVEPGFGGQKFKPELMCKVKMVRNLYKEIDIEVDGGINTENVHLCTEAGANMIVAGSAITSSHEPRKVITDLKKIAHSNMWHFGR